MSQSAQSQNGSVQNRQFTLDPFPTPNTPEWEKMNARRFELIRKKVRTSLSDEEQREFEYLQERTREAVEKAFPYPPDNPALESLLRELRRTTPVEAE